MKMCLFPQDWLFADGCMILSCIAYQIIKFEQEHLLNKYGNATVNEWSQQN